MTGESAGARRRLVSIRTARDQDFNAITDIYRASVDGGAASFEVEAPLAEEMRRRWRAVVAGRCPYLVAEVGGQVAGFAYARPFHERAAFAWTVEDSVYVAPDAQRAGVGRSLLTAVIEAAETAGFRQMVALISSDAEARSVPLHAALGFSFAGRITNVGYKHGRWHDIVYMQRALGAGSSCPPSIGGASVISPGG